MKGTCFEKIGQKGEDKVSNETYNTSISSSSFPKPA